MKAWLCAAAAAATISLAVPAAAEPLDRVQASLRATNTMVADFAQIDRTGRMLTGTLTLERPGKARFQYAPGVPMLMVADGKSLWYIDYKVSQVQRWPIGGSPLAVLLDPAADISKVARVVPTDAPGTIALEARDRKHPEFGTLTLAFRESPGAPGGLSLQGWTVLDAQNNRSIVRLSNQRYNVAVPANAFRWTDPRHSGRPH